MRISLSTGWQRCRGCLVFRGHFPQKSPMISGSFAERNLQMKAFYASSPPCSESNSQKSALQLFSAKEPLIIGLFLRKTTQKDKISDVSSPLCIKSNSQKSISTAIFPKRAINYRALLRKTTPCIKRSCCIGCLQLQVSGSFSAKEPYDYWLFCGK